MPKPMIPSRKSPKYPRSIHVTQLVSLAHKILMLFTIKIPIKPQKIAINIKSKMPPIPKGISKLLPKLLKKTLWMNKDLKKLNQLISLLNPGFEDASANKRLPQKIQKKSHKNL
jgi:hypothetical protein